MEEINFKEEVSKWVHELTDGHFESVDVDEVVEELDARTGGNIDAVTDSLIIEVVEDFGGEPIDGFDDFDDDEERGAFGAIDESLEPAADDLW